MVIIKNMLNIKIDSTKLIICLMINNYENNCDQRQTVYMEMKKINIKKVNFRIKYMKLK